jgi:X-X-X-Leu-X-X-Gly heptad repeat protein
LKVLLGEEADGGPHSLNDNSGQLGEGLITLASGILIVCAAIAVLRRKVISSDLPI